MDADTTSPPSRRQPPNLRLLATYQISIGIVLAILTRDWTVLPIAALGIPCGYLLNLVVIDPPWWMWPTFWTRGSTR
ncbi:hypothetical protein [Nocardiopsis synnemataformans]|uniref:hypothetical protein n=1 Tax=Nocardiopsis synnemataformans TaxID=61305 RepID=UPI003EBBD4DF